MARDTAAGTARKRAPLPTLRFLSSLLLPLRLHRVPPRADALHALVVAVQHLQRRAERLRIRPQIVGWEIFGADRAEQSLVFPRFK